MITRYSSRRDPLDRFLTNILPGATQYDRIAGYFRSSILEVAGDAIERMAEGACARIICNSDLHPLDVITARAAKDAMYREWRRDLPEDISPALQARLSRLHDLLTSGRMRVRVLPNERFGFAHGKAGVVRRANGRQLAFIGSANESRTAWTLNYELLWSDESPEGVAWTQAEFDALWSDPSAVDLADAVIVDVGRLARRTFIPDVAEWKKQRAPEPAAVAVELPIYRRENGLWAHQKYFVHRAFTAHQQGSARFVLADQVGLGKTIQLALAAKLMALWGGGRVLVVAPRTLLTQWQEELWTLLDMPSAVWTGRSWLDEQGVAYPALGIDALRRCPRRVGLVSAGLITQAGPANDILSALDYECVIVDEAHRARRRNLGPTHRNEKAEPNNLLRFVRAVALRTRSLLLATATPVQLDPIEAWDLLDALNLGNETVLGSPFSAWERAPRLGLDYVLGREDPPSDLHEVWEWMRDPFPPADESREYAMVRSRLSLPAHQVWARAEALERLPLPDHQRVARLARDFYADHNPYIRHIVRRTRDYLENTIDPQTNEPYLQPVRVRLFGEGQQDAVMLGGFLGDAYQAAEEFCEEIGKREGLQTGFLKTILLRRLGSTVAAGRSTALKMLGPSDDADEEDDDTAEEAPRGALYPLTDAEQEILLRVLALLNAATDEDPKYQAVERIILSGVAGTARWLDRGCIIFSQYYDSARWVAQRLSERLPDEPVGLYANVAGSGLYRGGIFTPLARETLKESVRDGSLRLLAGTDAASEGLNLQALGALINLDLPWNPTRLEQRKGRIQRIGQRRDEVYIYNMRYRGSVEDRVHQLLSDRLRAIRDLFGQLPDTLEDVWVAVALHDDARAREVIAQTPTANPFELRYDRIEPIDWESCSAVLHSRSQLPPLMAGW
ncbi:MAG TPA: phospholipase D-like domain-containing anti-phage protein [Ktedonobacterales bacterium]|jgi:superfamily II DNA or RNA helicase|nr:phospholipase D-like domain-containing anti-phage protein [Ktedonobacterales bacterium]